MSNLGAKCKSPLMGVYVFVVVLVCVPQLIASMNHYHQRDGMHVPCTFFDTVNVTGDMQFPNGSFLHDGTLIPSQLVGLYDYVYTTLVHREDAAPHWRACICKIKPCISICCPWGTYYSQNESLCVNTSQGIAWPEPILNVTLADDKVQPVNIFKQFAVQSFHPCDMMYPLQPEMYDSDEWKLFEDGTLLRVDDMKYFSKSEFCLTPTFVNESDTVYKINPSNCVPDTDYTTSKIINAYAMLFSIPFMVLTIVVYMAIPELRNQHGKSLVCYLIGLIIGYSLLSFTSLSTLNLSNVMCKTMGYVAYYSFMSAFFWLSVISFDLWHNFRGTRGVSRNQEKKRFIIYSVYSWGLSLVFLVFTWFAQEIADIPEYYKPGIGGGFYCWLDMATWAAMIYFFAPILIIIVANIVMFLMTAMKIHKVQREMARIMAREDSTRNLRTEKDKFGLFLRLFIVMGVTWSLEILSYFVGIEKKWSKIFYIADICNATQGFLIFMLFVMKKKVKHLITNRILKRRSPGTSHSSSTNSTNSDYTQNPDKYAMKMRAQNAVKSVAVI